MQPSGMEVPSGADQHAVGVDRPDVLRRAAVIRVGRLIGIGEGAVRARALDDVEDRVPAAVLHVEPDRVRADDVRRGRCGCGKEVEVVGDPDLLALRRQVVEHVVEDPAVGRAVLVAVAGRELGRRLLLAGGEEALGERRDRRVWSRRVEPHPVMQVDDVDRRNGAVGPLEVRRHPQDPPVDVGLGDLPLRVLDRVLPRLHVDRPELEVQMLRCPRGTTGRPARSSRSRPTPGVPSRTSLRPSWRGSRPVNRSCRTRRAVPRRRATQPRRSSGAPGQGTGGV